jgi:Helix-turn-helix domain
MGLWVMSDKELSRFEVLQRVLERRMTQQHAGQLLGLTRRQIYRLLSRIKQHGAAGLVSKRRGRRSNYQLAPGLAAKALALIRQHYADFGPTLAGEKLRERHQLRLSVESVRKLMMDAGLWTPRALRDKAVHQPRMRRQSVGELIQIDGCEHAWFEDRGPRCSLLVYVDDATSRIMAARFVAAESTFAYMETTRAYIERHGKPLAFYSDRHSVFNVNQTERLTGEGVTQFHRALGQLGIELICANTSQAKGRVERAHLTLQDRLVKEPGSLVFRSGRAQLHLRGYRNVRSHTPDHGSVKIRRRQ